VLPAPSQTRFLQSGMVPHGKLEGSGIVMQCPFASRES